MFIAPSSPLSPPKGFPPPPKPASVSALAASPSLRRRVRSRENPRAETFEEARRRRFGPVRTLNPNPPPSLSGPVEFSPASDSSPREEYSFKSWSI